MFLFTFFVSKKTLDGLLTFFFFITMDFFFFGEKNYFNSSRLEFLVFIYFFLIVCVVYVWMGYAGVWVYGCMGGGQEAWLWFKFPVLVQTAKFLSIPSFFADSVSFVDRSLAIFFFLGWFFFFQKIINKVYNAHWSIFAILIHIV